jgi:hypothetical protein
LSRISEFEPRRGDDDRKARRRWPGSAWFAVGTLVVLNLICGALIVKNELKRAGSSVSPRIDLPRVEPRPDVQSAPNTLPDQSSKPTVAAPKAEKGGDSNADVEDLELHPSPKPAKPLTRAKAGSFGRATVTRAGVTPRHYIPEPPPQERFAAPQVTPSRTYVPVPAPVAAPSSNAVAAPPALDASVRTPAVGKPPQPSPKVTAPNAAARQAQPALNPKAGASEKQAPTVASVQLPGMEQGWVPPKKPVGPLSPKIEIIHRPPEPKADVPNCGGAVVIPCPTLKKRPAGGSPDGDRW